MDLFGAVLIQKFCTFPQLGSPYNGIIDQHHALVLNQCVNRYQLHPGNQVPLGLIGRHKGAGPGRCVFNERTGKWNAGFIGISNRMGNTGVRHACYHISAHLVSSCQLFSAAVAHLLYVDSLISRGWVSIINPHKGAEFHLLLRRAYRFGPFRRNQGDFCRPQFFIILIAQINKRGTFKRSTNCAFLSPQHQRRPAHFIPGSVNPLRRHNQHRHRSVDQTLGIANPLHYALLLIN